MALHRIEYGYMLPEWSTIDIDIDAELDIEEREAIAIAEIKEYNPDISDIEILYMEVLG